jgi:uncharacterized protein
MPPENAALPKVISIFPLTGALLLPGGRLPLYIFEPRYVAMVEDALASSSFIGMVQPRQAFPGDNRGQRPPGSKPEIYDIGCLGRIEIFERLPPEEGNEWSRYVILLEGVRRFSIVKEIEEHCGYRRVEVDFSGLDDGQNGYDIDPKPLLEALGAFGRANGLELEIDKLLEIPGVALLHSIAMALPFAPLEKQALLEAVDLERRHELLLGLLRMGLEIDPRKSNLIN